ncbi:MAG TPA: hypothetical protein PK915_08325 [Bacteroidales bacterium]|nr:hypothetical protein [Bacteroidales bacterium]
MKKMINPAKQHPEWLKGKKEQIPEPVPKNYFEELPDRVMKKIEAVHQTNHYRTSGKALLKIAAGILILMTLSFFYYFFQIRTESQDEMVAGNSVPITMMKDDTIRKDTNDGKKPIKNIVAKKENFPVDSVPDLNNIFEELDKIPVETLMNYLNNLDEFEF